MNIMWRTALNRRGLLTIGIVGGLVSSVAAGDTFPSRLAFDVIDADASGRIERVEFDAMAEIGFSQADINGDGMLSVDELAGSFRVAMEDMAMRRATRTLERRDSDGDGLLALAELDTGRSLERQFERLDADDDGSLTEQELSNHDRDRRKRRWPWSRSHR